MFSFHSLLQDFIQAMKMVTPHRLPQVFGFWSGVIAAVRQWPVAGGLWDVGLRIRERQQLHYDSSARKDPFHSGNSSAVLLRFVGKCMW